MKKLSLIMASLLTASVFTAAAEEANPNRLLVTDKGGVTSGYVIDYLDEMSFARVDGEVLAKVTVDDISLNNLTLTIIKSPECVSYKLAVLTQMTANQLGNDANAIRYINTLPSGDVPTLTEDFHGGKLSGVSLNADSKYSIITVGIDRYGIESGVSRTDFATPAPQIVGEPHVAMTNLDSTLDSFTVRFTPNKDVVNYWVIAGEKGIMQSQYEQYAPMFGFSNFSEMIQMWGGTPRSGLSEVTWTDMAPNQEYEVFVAMTDAKGNFAPYEVSETATKSLGGKGEALVNITLSGFAATDWDGVMRPTQAITYSPNDQASCYRYGLYVASVYDKDKTEIQKDLCSDPEMPMAYWFQYFEGTSEYAVDLNTEYVAIAAAKNIDGTWGRINEHRFKTAASCPGYNPAPAKKENSAPVLRPVEKKFTPLTVPVYPTRKITIQ